jgi:hypothetical protein
MRMEITEDIRRMYGLPITKDIVYYPDKHKPITMKVTDIEIPWSVLEITLEDGTKKRIHSDYLADMQKPDFIKEETAEMENKNDRN